MYQHRYLEIALTKELDISVHDTFTLVPGLE